MREPFELRICQIDGNLNIPLGQLPARLDEIATWRNKLVVTQCKSGMRSKKALDTLRKNHYYVWEGKNGPYHIVRDGTDALTTRSIGRIVQCRAAQAGFVPRDFGGHSLKRGALTTGMERGVHPADLKRLGRHKSFDVLGE